MVLEQQQGSYGLRMNRQSQRTKHTYEASDDRGTNAGGGEDTPAR